MKPVQMSDNAAAGAGVIGTVASWSFSGALSVLATVLTIIVVGPKAWDQVKAWHAKYWPVIRERFRR